MEKIVERIREEAEDLRNIKIMEVCGGHTHTIVKYGLRDLMPKNVELISGPGCPVCVTSQRDIDNVIELALKGIKISTYSDLLRVPGTKMSLEDVRAKGGDIKEVYSVEEVLKYRDRVFFSIGFETTTPMSAFLLSKGVVVYSTNRLLMPILKEVEKDSWIDGFILPGHVSTIIGERAYKDLTLPGVITGFEPEDVLSSIFILVKMIKEGRNKVVNNYERAVRYEGNLKAQEIISKTMKVVDMEWRGFGLVKNSGLVPKNKDLDARVVYKDILDKVESRELLGCKCPEIVKGKAKPNDCPLFGKVCFPDSPKGPCMVSEGEGPCNIHYHFLRR